MAMADTNEPEMALLSRGYSIFSVAFVFISTTVFSVFGGIATFAITHWWTHVSAPLFAAVWIIAASFSVRKERRRRHSVLAEFPSSVRVESELRAVRAGLLRTSIINSVATVLIVVVVATHNPFVIDHLRNDQAWWFWVLGGLATATVAADAARRLRALERLQSRNSPTP